MAEMGKDKIGGNAGNTPARRKPFREFLQDDIPLSEEAIDTDTEFLRKGSDDDEIGRQAKIRPFAFRQPIERKYRVVAIRVSIDCRPSDSFKPGRFDKHALFDRMCRDGEDATPVPDKQ